MRAAWNDFFHATERPDSLAAVRILLCGSLMIGVLQRLPHARELISLDGAAAPRFAFLADLVPGGTLAVAIYAVLALALAAGTIGWHTRLSLAIAAVLLPYVGLLDDVSTLTKYTVVATHGLLILACSPCAAAWSVDARLRGAARSTVPLWPRRLLQIFLCVLYFATAVTKVQTPTYLTGEHLTFWMLTDTNAAHPLGHWLATHPTLAVLASMLPLLWEALFAVLIWQRPLRRPMLLAGVGFHVGTYFLLGLWLFPLVMLALYPAFVAPAASRRAMLRLAIGLPRPNWQPLRPWATATGFAFVAAIATVTAVEAEYRLDPLDLRHPERRPAAAKLTPEEAAAALAPTGPLEPSDWIYRTHVGQTFAAGILQSVTAPIAPGPPPLVQMWIHQPHPDFWLQTDLLRLNGPDETILSEGGVAVLRELRSASYRPQYASDLPPGSYAIALKFEGKEFDRVFFDVAE